MAAAESYPVRVDAALDTPLSRWLWLVKWLLVIPHYIVLVFLWIAFFVMTAVAFAAILITGRYPRAIFDFNVGVLRWTWRVQYYAIGAFGTDRYPPFTLAEVPGYPAHLDIEYPARLSRGLVLVKWWLLAIPQYLIIAIFTGGGTWVGWQAGNQDIRWSTNGLIGLMAVIAAVILLFSGRYPQQLFDFVLGMNRWVLRVAAYAGLMTDKYPPFRLDMGGHEPNTLTVPPGPPEPGTAGPPPEPPAGTGGGGWTTGRVLCAIAGAVLVVCSLGLIGTGGAAVWADTAHRQGGLVDLGTRSLHTGGYAVTSGTVVMPGIWWGWDATRSLVGTVQVRVTQDRPGTPVFAGVAAAGAADRYLAGAPYATVTGTTDSGTRYLWHSGRAIPAPPATAGIWAAQAAGTGTQVLRWQARAGHWTFVAMNADRSRPVSLRVGLAATFPSLGWIAAGLLAGGAVLLAGGCLLIAIPVRRAG